MKACKIQKNGGHALNKLGSQVISNDLGDSINLQVDLLVIRDALP